MPQRALGAGDLRPLAAHRPVPGCVFQFAVHRSVEHGKISGDRVAQVLKDCLDDIKLTIDSMEPVDADLALLLTTLHFRLKPRLEDSGIRLVWSAGSAHTRVAGAIQSPAYPAPHAGHRKSLCDEHA